MNSVPRRPSRYVQATSITSAMAGSSVGILVDIGHGDGYGSGHRAAGARRSLLPQAEGEPAGGQMIGWMAAFNASLGKVPTAAAPALSKAPKVHRK